MAITDSEYLFKPNERFYLDSNSPVPLYHQMQEIVHSRISGENALGRMLPAERDLMVIFGVSRATAKKTLDNLANKGLIQRRRALGTKVIRQEITERLTKLTSYTEEMTAKGLSVRSQVLSVEEHEPDEERGEWLQLKPGQKTLCIRRLRGTSEVFPVVLLHSELSPVLGVDPNADFNRSLYGMLEREYHVRIEFAEEEIRARGATPEEAAYLQIEPGDCVLVMERLTFTANNQPIETVTAVYRSEHFKYLIRLPR